MVRKGSSWKAGLPGYLNEFTIENKLFNSEITRTWEDNDREHVLTSFKKVEAGWFRFW